MNFVNEARKLITETKFGIMSTFSSDDYPFGSLVQYALTTDFALIIQVALIAEHYKNIKNNTKSTLLIMDKNGFDNPIEAPRATCFLNWTEVDSILKKQIQKLYYDRLGETIPIEIESGFTYFVSPIEKIRWIGGFGKIGWIEKGQLSIV